MVELAVMKTVKVRRRKQQKAKIGIRRKNESFKKMSE